MSKFDNFKISSDEEELERKREAYWEKCRTAPVPKELDHATMMWVRTVIDRHGWLRSKLRSAAVQRARVSRGVYECQCCGKHLKLPEGEVDHAIPKGLVATSLDEYVKLCLNPNVVANWICKTCHKDKTKRDKQFYGKG